MFTLTPSLVHFVWRVAQEEVLGSFFHAFQLTLFDTFMDIFNGFTIPHSVNHCVTSFSSSVPCWRFSSRKVSGIVWRLRIEIVTLQQGIICTKVMYVYLLGGMNNLTFSKSRKAVIPSLFFMSNTYGTAIHSSSVYIMLTRTWIHSRITLPWIKQQQNNNRIV